MPAKRISHLLKSHSLGLAGANAQSAGPVAPQDPIAVDSVLKPYFLAGRGTRRVDANFDSRACEKERVEWSVQLFRPRNAGIQLTILEPAHPNGALRPEFENEWIK